MRSEEHSGEDPALTDAPNILLRSVERRPALLSNQLQQPGVLQMRDALQACSHPKRAYGVLLHRLLPGVQSARQPHKISPFQRADESNDLVGRTERRLSEVETVRHVDTRVEGYDELMDLANSRLHGPEWLRRRPRGPSAPRRVADPRGYRARGQLTRWLVRAKFLGCILAAFPAGGALRRLASRLGCALACLPVAGQAPAGSRLCN